MNNKTTVTVLTYSRTLVSYTDTIPTHLGELSGLLEDVIALTGSKRVRCIRVLFIISVVPNKNKVCQDRLSMLEDTPQQSRLTSYPGWTGVTICQSIAT